MKFTEFTLISPPTNKFQFARVQKFRMIFSDILNGNGNQLWNMFNAYDFATFSNLL